MFTTSCERGGFFTDKSRLKTISLTSTSLIFDHFFSSGGSVLDERNFGRNFQQSEKGNFYNLVNQENINFARILSYEADF